MIFVVLTMLACLLLSAAVAMFVAFPARGRRLSAALTSVRPSLRRPAVHDAPAGGPTARRPVQEART
jgi:hypothetical protein